MSLLSGDTSELLETVRKIHGLLELLAEDKIAERDARQRNILIEIAGASSPLQKSILHMDGTRTQAEIATVTSANKGHLSTLVGRLRAAKLLEGDPKLPKLAISIPQNFFEKNG